MQGWVPQKKKKKKLCRGSKTFSFKDNETWGFLTNQDKVAKFIC